jgi:hypothetical protein
MTSRNILPILSDIQEVSHESKGIDNSFHSLHMSLQGDGIDTSYRISLAGEQPTVITEGSTSRKSRPQSVVVSLDPTVLQMISVELEDGVEDGDGDDDDSKEYERKSQLFCFCCCDLVRACVITNSVYIIIMVFLLLVSVLDIDAYHQFDLYHQPETYDDDDDGYRYDDEYQPSTVQWQGILALIRTAGGLVFAVVGIFGASKFHRGLVLSSAIFYCIYALWSLLDRRWSGALMALFFSYPNFHLFAALHRGSISKENYEKSEEHCCCGAGND